MTVTAAGQRHLAEMDARRQQTAALAKAERLADDIAGLARWDLAWTDMRRGSALRAGHVIATHPATDTLPDRVELLEVTFGGAGANLGGVDATGVDPCVACGMLPRGAWDTRKLTVPADRIVEVRPSGGRHIVAHKLAAAAAARKTKADDAGFADLVGWARELCRADALGDRSG